MLPFRMIRRVVDNPGMQWFNSPAARERRLAARRIRRLRQALELYGLNEDDGLPTEVELQHDRDAALIELLRDYRLFYGTPGWDWRFAAAWARAR